MAYVIKNTNNKYCGADGEAVNNINDARIYRTRATGSSRKWFEQFHKAPATLVEVIIKEK